MAKRQFEIQGSTLRIGGVDLQAGTTGVVIPGVTQATSYRVEEVEETGDQTQTFSGTVTVIDKVTYDSYVASGSSTGKATFNVDLKDNGKIDEIEVDNEGTYTSAQASANNDMYAYTGSSGTPFSPFVSSDWATIPFRPKMRAGNIETIGGGGGGATSLDALNNVNISDLADGDMLRWDDNEEEWVNSSIPTASTSQLGAVKVDGTTITISNDGVISSVGGSGGQQYGYLNQYTHSTTDDVDMEAVVMDSLGNSYVSYSFYNNNISKREAGIIKLDSSGSVVWAKNFASPNTNAEYLRISSLEYATFSGNDFIVALGSYYDNVTSKENGFMYFINPIDGSTGAPFDNETGATTTIGWGMEVNDGVFGPDSSNDPYAVIVGESYAEVAEKSFTPQTGTAPNKLLVTWAEYNASGLLPNEYIYYTVGGNYQFRMNGFYVTATLDGNPANGGLGLIVSINQNGTYNIIGSNGWSGIIAGWGNPVNVRVLGSYLGGVDVTNDLTFDLDYTALTNNSNNVAGWASNIQGTAYNTYVVGTSGSGLDLTDQIGNLLSFDYQLQTQAYIARLGSNTWSKSLGSSEYERLHSVAVDSSGNAYAGGYYWTGNKGSFVVKYDVSGVEQWAVHIDPASNTGNSVTSVDLLTDGNLIVVDEEGCVTKLNSSNGSIIWQVRVDPSNNISWNSDFRGTATPDGNYIFTNYEDNDYTLYVMCVSGTNGSEIWSKRITRFFAGTNGEIYPQDDFDAQYIDCNATSVTIAASTYFNLNGNSTYAGLIINFPISGDNTDGQYDQYLIESVTPGWSTETTTSTSVTVNTLSSTIDNNPSSVTGTSNSFTATETLIGTEGGVNIGNFEFDGDILTINNNGSEDITIRAIDDLYLEAQGDDIHLRAEDDIRLYTDYNFTDGSYSWLYRFNSGGDFTISDSNGTYGTIQPSLEGSDRVLIIGGESEAWIRSDSGTYTWKFDKNGVTQIPGLIQGNGNVNISIDSNFTAANQLFRFRGGDIASHLHFDTSNSVLYDLYVGDDSQYVKVSKDGTIDVGTQTVVGGANTWQFDRAGDFSVPGDIKTKYTDQVGLIFTNIPTWDSDGSGIYTWFNVTENDRPDVHAVGQAASVGWTVQVNGGNSATITSINPAGFFSFTTNVPLTGTGTLNFTSANYQAPQPTDLVLRAGVSSLKLRTNGDVDANDSVRTFKSVSQTVGASVAGTIWNTTLDIQTVKFLVYGLEATTGHSQSCEVLVTKAADGTLATTVYALVHTSATPLYTLDAGWAVGTTRLDATVPGANSVTFHVHATALFYD